MVSDLCVRVVALRSWLVLLLAAGGSACRTEEQTQLAATAPPALSAERVKGPEGGRENAGASAPDRLTARKLAQAFAFDQRQIPQPIDVSARKEPSGEWVVHLSTGYFETVDGKELGWWDDWDEIIIVSPCGQSSVFRIPERSTDNDGAQGARQAQLPEVVPLEPGSINEEAAILVARSRAMHDGLIPTEMSVEERQLDNGEWLVSFVPGVYLSTQPGESPIPFKPCVVHVDRVGQCRFFSKSE